MRYEIETDEGTLEYDPRDETLIWTERLRADEMGAASIEGRCSPAIADVIFAHGDVSDELWAKFTPGERLAYGVGFRRGRADRVP